MFISRLEEIPYDPSNLSSRIQQQLLGLEELSLYLSANPKVEPIPEAGSSSKPQESNELEGEGMDKQLTRINIGEEWWIDMYPDELQSFLGRKKEGEYSITVS